MHLTRSQFATAVRADEKWVENAARTLGRRLEHTSAEARWMGIVRLVSHDFGIPIARAAALAGPALRQAPETPAFPLAVSADGSATLVIDLARYHSTFGAALSAAIHHGGPRRRGRRRPATRARGRDAIAAAEAYGVDVSLIRAALERTPAERLTRLDANSAFLSGLRRVPAASSPTRRARAAAEQ